MHHFFSSFSSTEKIKISHLYKFIPYCKKPTPLQRDYSTNAFRSSFKSRGKSLETNPKTALYLLCFPCKRPTFPPWKPYVSRSRNQCFPHEKYKNFSCFFLSFPPHLSFYFSVKTPSTGDVHVPND